MVYRNNISWVILHGYLRTSATCKDLDLNSFLSTNCGKRRKYWGLSCFLYRKITDPYLCLFSVSRSPHGRGFNLLFDKDDKLAACCTLLSETARKRIPVIYGFYKMDEVYFSQVVRLSSVTESGMFSRENLTEM